MKIQAANPHPLQTESLTCGLYDKRLTIVFYDNGQYYKTMITAKVSLRLKGKRPRGKRTRGSTTAPIKTNLDVFFGGLFVFLRALLDLAVPEPHLGAEVDL